LLRRRGRRNLNSFESNLWTEINSATAFWLKFSSFDTKFYGIPLQEDLGSYEIDMIATDSVNEIPVLFEFSISNDPPYLGTPLQDQVKNAIIKQNFELVLSDKSFIDPDNDELVYTV
jgi:hypothetical protein